MARHNRSGQRYGDKHADGKVPVNLSLDNLVAYYVLRDLMPNDKRSFVAFVQDVFARGALGLIKSTIAKHGMTDDDAKILITAETKRMESERALDPANETPAPQVDNAARIAEMVAAAKANIAPAPKTPENPPVAETTEPAPPTPAAKPTENGKARKTPQLA